MRNWYTSAAVLVCLSAGIASAQSTPVVEPSCPRCPASAPVAATVAADECGVLANLRRLNEACSLLEAAAKMQADGAADAAVECYRKVCGLVPGSRHAQTATRQLQLVQDAKMPAVAGAEVESEEPPTAPSPAEVKRTRVDNLLTQSYRAWRAGDRDSARLLGYQAAQVDAEAFAVHPLIAQMGEPLAYYHSEPTQILLMNEPASEIRQTNYSVPLAPVAESCPCAWWSARSLSEAVHKWTGLDVDEKGEVRISVGLTWPGLIELNIEVQRDGK